MNDGIGAVDQAGERAGVVERADHGLDGDIRELRQAPRQHADPPARPSQMLDDVSADKPCRPGDGDRPRHGR